MDEPKLLTIAAQGLAIALTTALVVMPGCILLARKFGIVDKPGGRKTHAKVTPLLGGVGVVFASAVGFAVVNWLLRSEPDYDLDFDAIAHVVAGSLVLFLIGLIDDVFKETMTFQPKLLGQVIGVLVLMWPNLQVLWNDPTAPAAVWVYQFFFLCWYLTIVNSFNFSDNMNGLMSGLSVIAFAAAILYLQTEDRSRTMMVAVILVGSLLGFLPFNFPRSRIFLGDAGSMFIGFWMAWIMFDLIEGFMGDQTADMGANHLVPAVLIMGVPLYDAAFVVFMRWREKRPIYLGDNHHLSHRLVRGGFTPVEAVTFLWGMGFILAWVGILARNATEGYRYLLFGASLFFMMALTAKIISLERAQLAAGGEDGDDP